MSSEGYQQNYSGEKLCPVANTVMLKPKLARPGIKKKKKKKYNISQKVTMLNSLFAAHQDSSSNERRLLLVLCAEVQPGSSASEI